MYTPYRVNVPHRGMRSPGLVLVTLLLGLSLLLSACGGGGQTQQQADQNKNQLDHTLQHAQSIGVSSSLLKPIMKQEQQLSSTGAPSGLFNDQAVTDYYRNLTKRYAQLTVQVQAQVAVSTDQSQLQAQRDLQTLQTAITRQRALGFSVQYFTQQASQEQTLLTTAKYPKDYAAVSKQAHSDTQALDLMQATSGQLALFKKTVDQLQLAHIDVTAMQAQYHDDQQLFTSATSLTDFQHLGTMIDAQYQQAVVNTVLALPYVTAAKFSELTTQVSLLKSYGINTDAYQKRLATDQAALGGVQSIAAYFSFSKQIDADIAAMHNDLVEGGARYLVKQFHQEMDAWSKANPYHNPFDGQDYSLDASYALPGSVLDDDLAAAQTPDDFQGVMDEANNALFNLRLLEADYKDKTPYNQVHATDLQALDHYKLQGRQVLMVSLVEQSMRIYQDGKLVKSFLVTTGRFERPSVPGVWPVLQRLSPTTFYSDEPAGSAFWYPPTPIHYAMLYHSGGYFVHDSWWRATYGPGTQFPHADASGDTVYSGNGSHGCINMQEDQAAWVYNNTDMNTIVVIY